MTSRERMLAAYRNQIADRVPVSPELWYDIPLEVTGVPFEDVCLGSVPLWKVQIDCHRRFGTDGWIVAFPGPSPAAPQPTTRTRRIETEVLEIEQVWTTSHGEITRVTRNTPAYYDWAIRSPVQDMRRDMPAWIECALPDPAGCDLGDVRACLEGTGEDGLVTVFVGKLFFDFVASAREGGSTQAVYDFCDDPAYLRGLHEIYLDYMKKMARRLAGGTSAQVLFIENGYSSLGAVSPQMYRTWDIPIVRAVAEVAHEHGKLLHVHQHGPCLPLLEDLVQAGVDLVDPLERPGSGDVTDLAAVKRRYGGRIALRGNLHSHDVLLRGSVRDVELQVRECIEAAAPGGGYILATGDGAIRGTPHENIEAMVRAGEMYGRYT